MIPSIPGEDFWMLKMVLWGLPQTQLALQLWPLPSCKIYNSSKPCIISGYNGTYITRENNIHVSNIYGGAIIANLPKSVAELAPTCTGQLPLGGIKEPFLHQKVAILLKGFITMLAVVSINHKEKNQRKETQEHGDMTLGETFVTLENPGRPQCCENPWRLIFHFAYMPGSKALEEWEIGKFPLYRESFFQPLRGENKPLQLDWASHPLPWGNNGSLGTGTVVQCGAKVANLHQSFFSCPSSKSKMAELATDLGLMKPKNRLKGGGGRNSSNGNSSKPMEIQTSRETHVLNFVFGWSPKCLACSLRIPQWIAEKLHHPIGWPIASWWLNQPIWKYQSR